MKTGLLWYDADLQAGLPDRIARAAERYRQKFGRTPTLCYVNPAVLAGQAEPEVEVEFRLDGTSVRIQVIAAAHVLLHHYWLGEGDLVLGGRAARSEDRSPQVDENAARAGDQPQSPEAQRPRGRPLRAARQVAGSAQSRAGRAPEVAQSHLS
jgi:hypothetical protein